MLYADILRLKIKGFFIHGKRLVFLTGDIVKSACDHIQFNVFRVSLNGLQICSLCIFITFLPEIKITKDNMQPCIFRIHFNGFFHLGFCKVKFLFTDIEAEKSKPGFYGLWIKFNRFFQGNFRFIRFFLTFQHTGKCGISFGLSAVKCENFFKYRFSLGKLVLLLHNTGRQKQRVNMVLILFQNSVHSFFGLLKFSAKEIECCKLELGIHIIRVKTFNPQIFHERLFSLCEFKISLSQFQTGSDIFGVNLYRILQLNLCVFILPFVKICLTLFKVSDFLFFSGRLFFFLRFSATTDRNKCNYQKKRKNLFQTLHFLPPLKI